MPHHTQTGNVAVALYSESLCPDCRDFAPTFDAVWNVSCVQGMVSTYEEVAYGNAKTSGGKVTCQHGTNECLGNMLEACAVAHSTGMEWLSFITCMFANYPNVPAAGKKCSDGAGLNWADMTKCYADGRGAEGVALIAANAARTGALQPPHTYVPWLVVGGTPIPDPPSGGPSQADVVAAICSAYTGTKPACCSGDALAALEAAHPRPASTGAKWGSRASSTHLRA